MLLGLVLTACLGIGGAQAPPDVPAPSLPASGAVMGPIRPGEHVHHAHHGEHHHGHHEPDGCEHACALCCHAHAPAAATVPPGLGAPLHAAVTPLLAFTPSVELDPPPVRILHVPRPGYISG